MATLREIFLGTDSDSGGGQSPGLSDYDGEPLNRYTGTVDGRQVEVHTSWKPGDPER